MHEARIETGSSTEFTDIVVPLTTCERVLDALRRYEERDTAIDVLVADIERARTELLARLYGGA